MSSLHKVDKVESVDYKACKVDDDFLQLIETSLSSRAPQHGWWTFMRSFFFTSCQKALGGHPEENMSNSVNNIIFQLREDLCLLLPPLSGTLSNTFKAEVIRTMRAAYREVTEISFELTQLRSQLSCIIMNFLSNMSKILTWEPSLPISTWSRSTT